MNYPEFEYENTRRIGYDLCEGQGTAFFLPVCPKCGRYVKMDSSILWNEDTGLLKNAHNATCKKDGRITILCEYIN